MGPGSRIHEDLRDRIAIEHSIAHVYIYRSMSDHTRQLSTVVDTAEYGQTPNIAYAVTRIRRRTFSTLHSFEVAVQW